MLIGIKDLAKFFAITIVTCCAIFVCALFLNYTMDVVGIKDDIATPQGLVLYDAQLSMCKVIVGVSGGCLVATTIVLLIFYVKNYIDSHKKELGILKALGYSCIKPEGAFYLFVKTPTADENEFCAAAKKHNILVVPGSTFACQGFVRIGYCVSYETIQNAMPGFAALAEEFGLKG